MWQVGGTLESGQLDINEREAGWEEGWQSWMRIVCWQQPAY